MKRKYRHGIVRIAVQVIVPQRRIVDRQRLNHLLTRSRSPVRHLLQILELTDSETFFRPQREHGNGDSGTFPAGLRATESAVVLVNNLTFLNSPYLAVLAPFGIDHSTGLEVINDIFVLDYILTFHLYVGFPDRELGIAHYQFVIRIPVAQRLAVTNDRHALRRLDLRQVDRETDVTLRCFHFRRFVAGKKRFQEYRRIETVLIRTCLPCVPHDDLTACFGFLASLS